MKILEINDCMECPFGNHKYKSCNEKDYVIDDYPNIPKWCPLEDANSARITITSDQCTCGTQAFKDSTAGCPVHGIYEFGIGR